LFCKQKPLLKNAYATFLQAKTFTKKHSHCFSFSTGFLFSKKKKCVYAYKFKGKRYDAGDKLGYVKAIIDSALERADLREEIERYLREIVAALPQSFKVK
ncbi:MAG: hypothetical protein KAV25_09900, partial [Methanophagales archaeon]|nr:hypothetical protein [Methanophagales archaeon]